MRVAVISDIHGNLVSLERVLEVIESEGIDHMVCLGDIAATGPQPHQVIQRLRSTKCPVIMGNADAWLLNPTPPGEEDEDGKRIIELNSWCSRQLTQTDRDYLLSFPATYEMDLDHDLKMLCCHGSPQSNMDRILATTQIEDLHTMLGDVTGDIMACGHTHLQLLRRHMSQLIFNPGSVGMPYDVTRNSHALNSADARVRNPPWAEYGIVDSTKKGFEISFRRTPVDLKAVVHAALGSGMPNPEWWIRGWR
jgi:putative phosphoesterase